jgi:hypothetical protein
MRHILYRPWILAITALSVIVAVTVHGYRTRPAELILVATGIG